MAFAERLRSPGIVRLLLQERQRLAQEWLRITRREAGCLYRLHVRAVRHATDLRPAAEARLLAEFCVFWIVSELMYAMVRFYGPVRTRGFLRSVQSMGGLLSSLSGRIAANASLRLAPEARPNH